MNIQEDLNLQTLTLLIGLSPERFPSNFKFGSYTGPYRYTPSLVKIGQNNALNEDLLMFMMSGHDWALCLRQIILSVRHILTSKHKTVTRSIVNLAANKRV